MGMTRRNDELLKHCGSLPYLYRDIFHEIFMQNKDLIDLANARDCEPDELASLYEIAVDLFLLLDEVGNGATLIVMSEDHHAVAQYLYAEGLTAEQISQEMSIALNHVRQLIQELQDLLIPGALDLIAAFLELPEKHRTVFTRIFFNGETPSDLAEDLCTSTEQVRQLWIEAVDAMFARSENERQP